MSGYLPGEEFRLATDGKFWPAGHLPREPEPGACCHLHKPEGCCDPEDCGPCCENCPTCPVLIRQRTPRDGLARAPGLGVTDAGA